MLRNVCDWGHACSHAGTPVAGISACLSGGCEWSNPPAGCCSIVTQCLPTARAHMAWAWQDATLKVSITTVAVTTGHGIHPLCNAEATGPGLLQHQKSCWNLIWSKSPHCFSSECFKSSSCFSCFLRLSAEPWDAQRAGMLEHSVPRAFVLVNTPQLLLGQAPRCPQLLIRGLIPPGGGCSRTKIH